MFLIDTRKPAPQLCTWGCALLILAQLLVNYEHREQGFLFGGMTPPEVEHAGVLSSSTDVRDVLLKAVGEKKNSDFGVLRGSVDARES